MDQIWNELTSKSIGSAVITLLIWLSAMSLWMVSKMHRQMSLLSQRIENIEADRAWINKRRDEQLTEIEMTLYIIRDEVKDASDYQHGRGAYAYDPDQP